MQSFDGKRITVFVGHYGSGKTNIAVNYALMLRERHDRVTLVDLDIVNPYFRSADFAGTLEGRGIKVVASGLRGSTVELPSVPRTVGGAILDERSHVVMDVGGDDRGALALGRFAREIAAAPHEIYFTVNMRRPLTGDPVSAARYLREIEAASRLSATALVSNPNIGRATTAQDVLAAGGFMDELSKITGLPVMMTAALRSLAPELEARSDALPGRLFPMDIYIKEAYDFSDTL